MKTILLAALGAATIAVASPAAAQEYPLKPGEYWEVTGIKVDDGASMKYASWLATEWRRFNDYAKSQGWISDYTILANVHNRKDEPDVYLITQFTNLPDATEIERRNDAFRRAVQRTNTQLESESGQRAQYRHVMSTSLLQEMMFRN